MIFFLQHPSGISFDIQVDNAKGHGKMIADNMGSCPRASQICPSAKRKGERAKRTVAKATTVALVPRAVPSPPPPPPPPPPPLLLPPPATATKRDARKKPETRSTTSPIKESKIEKKVRWSANVREGLHNETTIYPPPPPIHFRSMSDGNVPVLQLTNPTTTKHHRRRHSDPNRLIKDNKLAFSLHDLSEEDYNKGNKGMATRSRNGIQQQQEKNRLCFGRWESPVKNDLFGCSPRLPVRKTAIAASSRQKLLENAVIDNIIFDLAPELPSRSITPERTMQIQNKSKEDVTKSKSQRITTKVANQNDTKAHQMVFDGNTSCPNSPNSIADIHHL